MGTKRCTNRHLKQLSGDAFLSSTPTAIRTSTNGSVIEVQSHTSGGKKTIQPKNLLVAIDHALPHIQRFGSDMTDSERHLLGLFNNSYHWNAMINASGIPPNTDCSNANLNAPYSIRALPAAYTFGGAPGTANLVTGYFGSPF